MTNDVIPASTKLAAKRGFIRTATLSLASVIPTTGISIVLPGDWLLGIGLGTGGALATAVLAGTASYLSIVSNGIPDDYVPAAIRQEATREL